MTATIIIFFFIAFLIIASIIAVKVDQRNEVKFEKRKRDEEDEYKRKLYPTPPNVA